MMAPIEPIEPATPPIEPTLDPIEPMMAPIEPATPPIEPTLVPIDESSIQQPIEEDPGLPIITNLLPQYPQNHRKIRGNHHRPNKQ